MCRMDLKCCGQYTVISCTLVMKHILLHFAINVTFIE